MEVNCSSSLFCSKDSSFCSKDSWNIIQRYKEEFMNNFESCQEDPKILKNTENDQNSKLGCQENLEDFKNIQIEVIENHRDLEDIKNIQIEVSQIHESSEMSKTENKGLILNKGQSLALFGKSGVPAKSLCYQRSQQPQENPAKHWQKILAFSTCLTDRPSIGFLPAMGLY